MKELLEQMIKVPGVSGFEDDIRDYIRSKAEAMGLKTDEDNLGDLLVTVGNRGAHIVFIAHMDELGLIVSKLESDGSLRVRKVGGIDDRTLVGRVVEIKTQKGTVSGVIGLKPPHLMTDREEMKKVLSWEDVRVHVGAGSSSSRPVKSGRRSSGSTNCAGPRDRWIPDAKQPSEDPADRLPSRHPCDRGR